MLISQLQQQLQAIYDLDNMPEIGDFLITDLARVALDKPLPTNTPEQLEMLLIQQDQEYLNLSLYIKPEILEQLQRDNPLHCLHAANMMNLAIVTEGISHFVYLCWNALHDRKVSLFELELQGEIDKYVLMASLFAQQCQGYIPDMLHNLLFNTVTHHHSYNYAALLRYQRANYYADLYCMGLHQALLRKKNMRAITRELRRVYRLLHENKLRHIKTLPELY